jgi:hypothetical protein
MTGHLTWLEGLYDRCVSSGHWGRRRMPDPPG